MPLTFTFGRLAWSASWVMTLLTAVAVTAFIDLGRWQWHRAAQKHALAVSFAAGTDTLATPLGAELETLPRFSQVRLHGRYDAAHQFLLDNMSHDGQPGYEVLTPFTLDDGRLVVVNRGWIPLTASRRELPDIHLPTPAAPLQLTGRLDALPVAGIALGHLAPAADAPWPRLTSFPVMADLALALGLPLVSRQLLLNPGEPEGFVRDWQPPGLPEARHLSYAVQWWGFAATTLVLFVVLNRRKRPA